MKTSDFKQGDKVRYIPGHAHGNVNHPDCEDGVVSSINEENVFVRYFRPGGLLRGVGWATSPDDLVMRS